MSEVLQNAIKVNHRGFLCKGKKRFILTENKTNSLDFSVYLIHNVEHVCVYNGKMVEYKENGKIYYEGDFSHITREGDYFILAGGFNSRHFVIYDGAYDICQRTMLHPLYGQNQTVYLDCPNNNHQWPFLFYGKYYDCFA